MQKIGRWLKNVVFSRNSQAVFVLIAVAMSTFALFYAYRNERRVKIEPNPNVTPTDAEYILARANDATQFADSIMGFLQGASALIGIVLVVGGWMFRNSIQVQIETLQDSVTAAVEASQRFVQEARQELEQRQNELHDLELNLQRRMDNLVIETTKRLEETQQDARNSFRVLSLQLLAEQQVRTHNIDTAVNTLQSALALDPDDHATNYLLGYLYTQRKQVDLAIKHLQHAIALEADFTPGIAALGLALRRKGDSLETEENTTERDEYWKQAEARLLEALGRDHRLTDADGESYYGTLGGLYRRQKRYYAALDAYEQAYKVTPNSSYPLINLASLHTHQGNMGQARYYFGKVREQAELALDDDPRNAWRRCDLAQAKLVLENKGEALKELQTVIYQEPERGVLETVYSGLRFLSEAPEPIPGLEELIDVLDQALKAGDSAKQPQAPSSGQN